MDLRQKTLPFVYDGKTYLLRCNMAVLADVQEASGGTISAAFSGKRGMKNALMFLSAMMTDYADELEWRDEAGKPLAFTWRALGRVLRPEQVPSAQIFDLVVDALTPPKSAESGKNNETPEETPGN